MQKVGDEQSLNNTLLLTVLFPKFRTRQLKYADFPTSAVTLLATLVSKYGSFHFGFKNELNGGCAVLLSVNVLYPSRGRWIVLAKPTYKMTRMKKEKHEWISTNVQCGWFWLVFGLAVRFLSFVLIIID